jgi:hypothetical protein
MTRCDFHLIHPMARCAGDFFEIQRQRMPKELRTAVFYIRHALKGEDSWFYEIVKMPALRNRSAWISLYRLFDGILCRQACSCVIVGIYFETSVVIFKFHSGL